LNKGVYKGGEPDNQGVIDMVTEIEKAGFKLEDNYFNVFSKTSANENIFTTDQGNRASRWYMTLHYDQKPSGWNGFTTLADFYGKFEDKDIRKGIPAKPDGKEFSGIGLGFLKGQQYNDKNEAIIEERSKTPLEFTEDVTLAGAATQKGIRVIKYHPANNGDYILARYGAAYLMKAEAMLRKGDKPGALKMVNDLRTKRGASALADLTLDSMLDEWGRETYWEGSRRNDEVRFGKFTTATGVVNKAAHTVLYPIPALAVSSNPNLRQNPGY
jgi:starch-binding outer membrane protein, SusD/RagB family